MHRCKDVLLTGQKRGQPLPDIYHKVINLAYELLRRHDIKLDGTVRFRGAMVEDGVFDLSLRNLQNIKKKSPTPRQRGPVVTHW